MSLASQHPPALSLPLSYHRLCRVCPGLGQRRAPLRATPARDIETGVETQRSDRSHGTELAADGAWGASLGADNRQANCACLVGHGHSTHSQCEPRSWEADEEGSLPIRLAKLKYQIYEHNREKGTLASC